MNLQKNRSQKLSMLEEKTGTVLESETSNPDFRLIFLMREDFRIKITITFFSPE